MYLKITNGQPEKYSIGQLRRDNPNTSFPKQIPDALLAGFEVYPYTVADVTYDPLVQRKVEGQFVQVDGQWTLFMVAEDIPQSSAESAVRAYRDDLLTNSDWTQMPDGPLSDAAKTEWANYRQQLRDVTSQAEFPYDVTWPTKP